MYVPAENVPAMLNTLAAAAASPSWITRRRALTFLPVTLCLLVGRAIRAELHCLS